MSKINVGVIGVGQMGNLSCPDLSEATTGGAVCIV